MKRVFDALIMSVAMLTPASAGVAQCGPKDGVAEQLLQLGEIPFASGIAASNSIKFFGNSRTGTWTMVLIRPDGLACVVAAGQDLEVSNLAVAERASQLFR
jgi:hypothetical protein